MQKRKEGHAVENSGKYIFEKLTPANNTDIKVYEDALDFVFKENDVRNIAISGAYGAGKSSLLTSYEEKKKHKFLHISLAHFQNPNVDSNSEEPKTADSFKDSKEPEPVREPALKEAVLEGKILNQLIHQIPAEKIPQTNFKVKKSTSNWNVFLCTVAAAILSLSLLHMFLFDNWTYFVSSLPIGKIQSVLVPSTTTLSLLISGIFSFLIACSFLYCIIRKQKNKNIFRKLNIQGNEIEIFEENEDSYFDKYLNEVLYLFENVDADVIVFEDMDRYDANRIFERLREINTLANLQRVKEGKPILRFFYLLRDDIFDSKDRTKFFDFIVPVVPVVDSSNSYDQFISHLKKNNLLEHFDERFLQGVSLYVDDMRLLKNICNEFLIYYNRINLTELDHNRMLALIIYKNLFPKDFSDLQLNRGYVFSLFENKPTFINDEISALQSEKEEKKRLIVSAKEEVAKSKAELNLIFEPRKIRYYCGLDEEDKAEYDRRLQFIEAGSEEALHNLEEEISECENRIQTLSNMPLSIIITRDNEDRIFGNITVNEIGDENDYREIKASEYFDLVKYLIRNGYIDETYADYMTYFYENSLSRVDKIFLRSITDRKAKPYTYKLNDPEKILCRLSPLDFEQEETQNFMLCDYLFEHKEYTAHLQHFIKQLRSAKSYSFVAQFFDQTRRPDLFVQFFNEQWSSIFADMQNEDGFDSKQLKRYSVLSLYYSDDDALKALNCDSAVSNYITESKDYLDIADPKIDKLISGFRLLDISFPAIDYGRADKALFLAVYQNDLYNLNFDNLKEILENVFGVGSTEEVRHGGYTVVLSDPNSPLYKRINNNFSDYCDIILEECNGEISDDEEAALSLLNRSDIDLMQKQRYIQYLSTHISVLKAIGDQTIWESLVRSELICCSEQNIMDYFCYKGKIDEALADFINASDRQLDFSKENTDFSDKQREALFDSVVNCNELTDGQYTQITTTFGFNYEEFNISGINDSKMRILIENSIIRMNSETLQFLRNEYASVLNYFIYVNVDEYVELITDELFDQSELIEVLTWSIPDQLKLELLRFSTKPISVIGKNYSVEICVYILTHNLLQKDMESLYYSYNRQPDEIKKIIESNAKVNIGKVIESPDIAALELREYLLSAEDVEASEKIDLFAAMIPDIDKTQACNYLSLIRQEEYTQIFDSHSRPKFEINEQSETLLEAFRQKGWIHEYLEDESRPGFYKIRRKEKRIFNSYQSGK